MQEKNKQAESIIIKKYANRRLYNTDTSTYITLDDLYEMVRKGVDFSVRDAKTGNDITNQILTQILLEQESGGVNLLPTNFLRSVIRFYDGEANTILPPYLEAMMENFNQHQQKWTENMKSYSALEQLEEIGKQNMALFQQAFQAFNPFDHTKYKK